MPPAQWITLAAALLAFAASIIATSVAWYNGRFRRFAEQRIWERKADAYQTIIEALSDLVYYHETHLRAAEIRQELSDARSTELREHWRRGHVAVQRAAAVGAFLISQDAETALRAISEGTKSVHPNDWYGMIEADYVVTRDALRVIVAAAKADLQA